MSPIGESRARRACMASCSDVADASGHTGISAGFTSPGLDKVFCTYSLRMCAMGLAIVTELSACLAVLLETEIKHLRSSKRNPSSCPSFPSCLQFGKVYKGLWRGTVVAIKTMVVGGCFCLLHLLDDV